MDKRPNVLVILNDDMGFSDIGCYGGEIDTPNLDKLAMRGLRFTQFYSSPRCAPTRASLLTGLHPHQTGIGILVNDYSPEGYEGTLNKKCVTISEILKENGYKTYMSGKWHLCGLDKEKDTWPCQRGFDKFYGIIRGATDFFSPRSLKRNNEDIEKEAKEDKNYYFTDAVSENAIKYIDEHDFSSPMFMYVAYTAPHWPLHAKKEDIKKYKGRFDEGWDILREKRMKRLKEMGIIDKEFKLTKRDSDVIPWEENEDKKWDVKRMEVYGAQIDCMDQGIGRIIDKLKKEDQFENTLIMFLSDNGGCAEEISENWTAYKNRKDMTKDGKLIRYGNESKLEPGSQDTYMSYGKSWANLSNAPFKLYKHYTHEGGISTPLIVSYPNKIKAANEFRRCPAQLTDILPTILEYTKAKYPNEYKGNKILPYEGQSLKPYFEEDKNTDRYLFFEHEGNKAVRCKDYKLVSKYPGNWELYNMKEDRTETNNIINENPNIFADLKSKYEEFEKRANVIDRDKMLKIMAKTD